MFLSVTSGYIVTVFYLKTCIFSLKLAAHFSITTLLFDFWPILNESSLSPEKKHPKVIGVKHACMQAYNICFKWRHLDQQVQEIDEYPIKKVFLNRLSNSLTTQNAITC